jgi:hypothetical protein
MTFKPPGWRTVTPRIFTNDVAGVVRFLKAVFDASGDERVGAPAEVHIGDSIVLVSDGGGQREALPAFLYIYVENADRTYQRAGVINHAMPLAKNARIEWQPISLPSTGSPTRRNSRSTGPRSVR